jgi:methyltransferase (TIGR00027 family)
VSYLSVRGIGATHVSRPPSDHELSGVAKTLLMPLYIRAIESQRPDALLRDDKAVALVAERAADFAWIEKIKMDDGDRVAIILRNRQFDRHARDFLARSPDAVVVHIGCGFDQRFERVDDGRVQWYDLDLPEVIELRRELIGGEAPRYHLLACSAFESQWIDVVNVHRDRPFLFMAEGVLMYFEEAQVRSLVLTLRERFPGSELVFDAFSPLLVRANNLRFRLSRTGIRVHYYWGLRHARDLESWSDGICLLDEWYPFDSAEPRLARVRWMRHVPPLARIMGVLHFRLGKPGPG